jgi:hypothetical protein
MLAKEEGRCGPEFFPCQRTKDASFKPQDTSSSPQDAKHRPSVFCLSAQCGWANEDMPPCDTMSVLLSSISTVQYIQYAHKTQATEF